MKTILIIGGAGFIGSNLAKKLFYRGYQIIIYDNFSTGRSTNLASIKNNIEVVRGDILDYRKLSDCILKYQPNVIFHLAAIHYIPDCNNNPEKTCKVNIDGTHNLLKMITTLRIKPFFVFISSAAVYQNSEKSLAETDKTQPICIYGKTKILGEKIIKQLCLKKEIPFVIIRLFNVYGPNDRTPHIIPTIISQLKNKSEVIKLGNLQPKRDFIYIDDVSDALSNLLVQKPKDIIYNLGTGKEYSIKNIVEKISKLLRDKKELKILSKDDLQRKVERPHLKADINKIKKEFHWQPKMDIDHGIKRLLKKEGLL